jgi:hypothetical protein
MHSKLADLVLDNASIILGQLSPVTILIIMRNELDTF